MDATEAFLPSISIITPSLNQAGFIERTIRSVADQDYLAAEHIIMDGGSTDGTSQVVQQLQVPGYLQWHSEPDTGQSNAINKGISLAKGTIVGWLNADDELFPNALSAIARAFNDHPDAGLIYGAGAKIDEAGNIIKDIPFREFDHRKSRTAFYWLQPSMFFRRDLYLSVGGVDESLHYAMDWDFLLRVQRQTKVYSIPERIGKLRCHGKTKTSGGGWVRMREIASIGRRHNGLLDRNYVSFVVRNQVARMQAFGGAFRRIVDFAMARMFSRGSYMVDAWPE